MNCVIGMTLGTIIACLGPGASAWSPVEGKLTTRWAKEVSPENALPEYPRPQMRRNQWLSLNGLWEYAILPRDTAEVATWDGEILVPFAVESALSGVGKRVSPAQQLWYRRTFETPAIPKDGRLLLHFGAVDWHAQIWVNDKPVGEHKGGYDPFTFDITDALQDATPQEIRVSVWDPTDEGTQPRGKQIAEPRGIWYTPVTGIWQTVWLEPVPPEHIQSILPIPDVDENTIRVRVQGVASEGDILRAAIKEEGRTVAVNTKYAFDELVIPIPDPKHWSPSNPYLYDLEVSLVSDRRVVDQVQSYCALRKIAVAPDASGKLRLFLNNEPLFQLGPLDQGWWPDGLYTAPTDAALRYDVEVTRDLGFNMLRKHVKVEPARFYYHCDQLGVMVWQDMPSAVTASREGEHLWVGANDTEDKVRPAESAQQFEAELKEVVQDFGHFPSIVMWVPFNEGWGQYDTERIAGWIKELDPTRLVNSVSGWLDLGAGDVRDVHAYPGPAMEDAGPGRAPVLGEFGGLGLPVKGHLWQEEGNWGYRSFDDFEGLTKQYKALIADLEGLLGQGLAAAVYTQTTDVEIEVNGFMTYDREVLKLDAATLQALHAPLYATPPQAKIVLATSQHAPQNWRWTDEKPGRNWATARFDDDKWESGPGPFQTGDNPNIPAGTKWESEEAWLRQSFTLEEVSEKLWLVLYHDVTAVRIYLNGEEVQALDEPRPSRRHYQHINLGDGVKHLKRGENVLAVYATKKEGSRAVDAGLYTLVAGE